MAGLLIIIFLILQSPSPLQLIIAMAAHETAHVATAALLTGRFPKLHIKGAGFILDCGPVISTKQRILINLSGPIVNLLLWTIFRSNKDFSQINFGLFIVSMLPCSFLDGGQITNALFEKLLPPKAAFTTQKILTYIIFSFIFIFNCAVQLKFGTNLSLLCFTIFSTLILYGKEG